MREYIRGNPKASVKLVEYADFECPFCGMAEPYVRALVERHHNEIALIFRPYPLVEVHPHAMHAAQAAEAAGLQNEFWPMHDLLFQNQSRLEDEDIFDYASTLGLDIERFKSDFTSTGVIDAIQESITRGAKDGVNGTPSFFLNGELLEMESFDDLERAVAQTIASAAQPAP